MNEHGRRNANPLRWIDPNGLEWVFKEWKVDEHRSWWSHYWNTEVLCYETCTKRYQNASGPYFQRRPIRINMDPVPAYDPGSNTGVVDSIFDIYEAQKKAKERRSREGPHGLDAKLGQKICSSLQLPPEASNRCCP